MDELAPSDPSPAAEARCALARAATLCEQRGTRLTDLRKRVLEIIWSSPVPLGAYAILDVLRDDGRQGAPPTVYRALDFLLEQGLIHRLATLNVFTGCRRPDSFHGGQFLICRDCGQVDELNNPTVEALLRAEASSRRFDALSQMIEVLGRCPECRREAESHAR